MFRSTQASLCLTAGERLIAGALFLLILLWASPGSAQVVAQYGFEDGTAQGWTSFNGAGTPVNSTAAAHTGTASLLTATNSGGTGGPGIRLTNLVPGASYQITGYILLTSGEAATAANLTIQRTDPGCSGGTCYDTIGTYQVPVSDSAWVQVGGTYTVSSTETGLLLYAQLVGPVATQSFYLDDVVINQISGPPGGPQDNSGISTPFED
jgi:endo-1,4-beta-xylanase